MPSLRAPAATAVYPCRLCGESILAKSATEAVCSGCADRKAPRCVNCGGPGNWPDPGCETCGGRGSVQGAFCPDCSNGPCPECVGARLRAIVRGDATVTDDGLIEFECPRCHRLVRERFYGPCGVCRVNLRVTIRETCRREIKEAEL